MTKKLDQLMERIGYQFKDESLLKMALSHRSTGKVNNERLEFLGDSVVNFVTASELYKRFSKAKEGQLSRLRANLVKGETLAQLAQEFELGTCLRLGPGEMKSGGSERISILADCLEAIIGAIYLDSNMSTCYKRVTSWYQSRLDSLSLDAVHKDPKSLLQEIVQGKQLPLPKYKLISVEGQEHEQKFIVECSIALLNQPVRGEGTSRRRAEQAAAADVLKVLQNEK